MEKALLSIPEFCHVTGVRETKAKELLRNGVVLSVRIGDRRLIPVDAVRTYVARLISEASAERAAEV